jgi:opacity protein-like surface antigen
MRNLRHAALAAVLLGMLPSSLAWSADYGGMKYGYPPPPVEIGSGWYMRGDLGYRLYAAPSMTETSTPVALTGAGASGAIAVGGGFGYQFSERFRGDLTVDFALPSTFRGTHSDCDSGTGDTCVHSIDVTAASAMVNAYFDLATIGGFTPYVGAGVGVAMVSTGTASAFNTVDSTTTTYPGATAFNLAWVLMAGATYEMSPDVLIDLGFRLASLGGASTGTVPAAAGGTGSGVISIGSIIAPEVRVGMRYKID